ncbi:inositol monophosphatase family protein [Demequina zhanjiangensis]|uniref:Inositol-1-monophosphatase n=1 Tax=Demequina zhanjiangensis TaxID=3051659 RepID=A0ABT8G0R2_9MICO|nr:inositol monophosphatase family protein [Demequina sp. SYSU T00b26]MDN4472718.1 inositol monophosphatase family protein [Demequina sp. SYSU T00b26]
MTDPRALLDVAARLAQEAGDLVVAGRAGARIAGTKSSSADIVTEMDLAAERLLRARLAELRPEDGILGEEGDDVPSSSGITWVLDPIDGTVNYAYGLPYYGVSVAAVSGPPRTHEWTQVAGALQTGSGELWTAARGEGAWRDGERLTRVSAPPLATTLLATGFQYVPELRAQQGEVVARMLPVVRDIRRLGAAALDLCHAAAGVVDAYYEHSINAWDMAAGGLIASEAGLKVAGIDGGPADERLVIAAHPDVWDDLAGALIAAGAERVGR